jgi:hypothetical protein
MDISREDVAEEILRVASRTNSERHDYFGHGSISSKYESKLL